MQLILPLGPSELLAGHPRPGRARRPALRDRTVDALLDALGESELPIADSEPDAPERDRRPLAPRTTCSLPLFAVHPGTALGAAPRQHHHLACVACRRRRTWRDYPSRGRGPRGVAQGRRSRTGAGSLFGRWFSWATVHRHPPPRRPEELAIAPGRMGPIVDRWSILACLPPTKPRSPLPTKRCSTSGRRCAAGSTTVASPCAS